MFDKLRARLSEIRDRFSGAQAPESAAPAPTAVQEEEQGAAPAAQGRQAPPAATAAPTPSAAKSQASSRAPAVAAPAQAELAPRAKVQVEDKRPRSIREEQSEAFEAGIFGKTLDAKQIDEILAELETALLEADVAVETVEAMKASVRRELEGAKVGRFTHVADLIEHAFRIAVENVLPPDADFDRTVREGPRPLVIMFVGINGTGKTTTIARIAHRLKKQGYSPVIAACDTFRAGAIDQLEVHAERLGVKLIKNQPGSDPASVAFDAIEHARARGKEVVLVDTAGRMQTNTNLMDEMKKMKRVAKPHMTIFVGDAWVGNDAVSQATSFNQAVGVDGVVLTKIDTDARGGAALSIAYAIGKPIFFVGTGQGYDDLDAFSHRWMVERIFGAAA